MTAPRDELAAQMAAAARRYMPGRTEWETADPPESEPDHAYQPVQTIEGVVCGYCKGPEHSPRHYPPVSADRDARPEGREGMVTVYDHLDRYLGCMGIETWRGLLAADRDAREAT